MSFLFHPIGYPKRSNITSIDPLKFIPGVSIKPMMTAVLLAGLFTLPALQAQTNLGRANYDDNNALAFPEYTDEWIHLGSSLGSEYADTPFDPHNPGTIGVVQMEPAAYRYLKQHGEYADGSMLLLSFYASEAESSPQLPGFVQGAMQAQEIHVIDREHFTEGRGFFLYPANAEPGTLAGKVPDGSECVECHMAEGAFNGTFTQFYPPIRNLVGK